MEPSLDELRANYERFPDNKLIRLATEQATDLRPEALDLLKQILNERGLSKKINDSIQIQFQEVSDEQIKEYALLLRSLPCPICNSKVKPLNATTIAKAFGMIVYATYEENLIIACPDCLDNSHNDARLKSILLGLWSFPKGIIYTIKAVMHNNEMKTHNNDAHLNNLLKEFVRKRVGRIEATKNNILELNNIIKYIR